MDKLASFQIIVNGMESAFSIYGECEIIKDTNWNHEEFQYPEFYKLKAFKIINGKEVLYRPSGTDWKGRKFDEEDMLQDFLYSLIRCEQEYQELYLAEELKGLVESYVSKEHIAVTVNGLDIPQKIRCKGMLEPYDLMVVTDKYIYYASYDYYLQLDVETHQILSANIFAEDCYNQSLSAIEHGEEKQLWIWDKLV